MKKNRLYILTIFACACAVFFAGCKDSAKSENAFYVSGKVIFPDALPSQLADAINANSNSRSATSSFSTLPAGYEFKSKASLMVVEPDDPDMEIVVADIVNVNLNTEDWSWSATFPQAGEWVIELSLVSSEDPDSILLAGNETISCNSYNTYENISIKLFPCYFTDVTSSISLDLYDSTQIAGNALSSVYCSWNSAVTGVDLPSVLENKSFSFTDKRATISYEEVPTGYYELLLSFRNSNNKELYSCRQIVTVFAGFTTDTWMNDFQLISDVVIDEENNISEKRFTLTDELLKTYQTTLVIDYPIVLYDLNLSHSDLFPREFNNHTPGFFVYPDLDSVNTISIENASLDSVYHQYSRSAIDPETQNIYRVDGYNPLDIYEYTSSYAGYKRNKIYTFTNGFEATSMCAYNGYVYLIKNTGMNNSAIIRVPYTGDDAETLQTGNMLANINVNQNMQIDVCDDVIYIVGNKFGGSDAELRVSRASIVADTQGGHTLGSVQTFSKDDESLENLSMIESIFGSYYLRITDLQVRKVDDAVYLYILVNCRQLSTASGCYLRGGIITVKITSTGENAYSCSIVKLNGDLPESGSTAKDVIFGWNEEYLQKDHVTSLATDTYRQTYFYGPTKFVARKPDELVIVDEANYYYKKDENDDIFVMPTAEEENDCIKNNINRVVTVSLKDFAITASVDTNFGFETYLGPVSVTTDADNVYVSYRTYKYRNTASSFEY